MKKLIILPFLLGTSVAFAQAANCAAVKAENAALKDKIATYEARLGIGIEGVKAVSEDEKFKINSCPVKQASLLTKLY